MDFRTRYTSPDILRSYINGWGMINRDFESFGLPRFGKTTERG